MRFQKLALLLFFGLIFQTSFAQWFFEVKFIGISAHLKKNPHPHLYQRKFDKNGFLVLNLGLIFSIEKMIHGEIVSLKFSQAIFRDCANQTAGFTHTGFRLHKNFGQHHLSIGNGPTLFYRKSWKGLPGYVDEGLFKSTSKQQYRYFWYAGEITYSYFFHEEGAFSTTFIPGPPEFATIAAGIRQAFY